MSMVATVFVGENPSDVRPGQTLRLSPAALAEKERIKSARLKILLVDDETRFREIVGRKLRKIYLAEVDEVGGAEEALKFLETGRHFDLVLMDVSMQPIDGFQACAEMQSRGVKARIVLMTGFDLSDFPKRADSLRVDLLRKPLQTDLLQKVLLRCVEGRS